MHASGQELDVSDEVTVARGDHDCVLAAQPGDRIVVDEERIRMPTR
jgi:hypothetical protein